MKMDAESNYESDLSESWSLLDINLNEESLITTHASSTLEKSCSPLLKNTKSREINETVIQDFAKKYKELNKIDVNQVNESNSESTFKKQNMETSSKKKGVQPFQSLDDDGRNDSGDAESIEILDMDGSYQDSETDRFDISVIDPFDFPVNQSDDEESSDGRLHNESRSHSSTVIKRKRRRVSRDVEDTVHCVYSENACKSYPEGVSDEFDKPNNHSVYKHYRNNVANKVLSLSVGVIFAGVACLAIGHFLGVQDAAETALELVETLKKLQVENAALQSRMVHLKKALLNLETNSKLELPLSQPQAKVSCEEEGKIGLLNTQIQRDLKNAALSEVCSSLNSIEWLAKLQNIVKKGTEVENSEINAFGLGEHINDQFNLFKERKKEGVKFSEDTDLLLVLKKLLIVLKKIMNKLSSHGDTEVVREKLVKLKNAINHNLNKLFRDCSRGTQHQNKMPVTELDLKAVYWIPNSKIHWTSEENLKSRDKFPQPQNYYDIKTHLKSRSSNNTLRNCEYEKIIRKKKKKYKGSEKEKSKGKKFGKKNWKKGKEVKIKKKDRKRKHALTGYFKNKESKYVKYVNGFRPFNESDLSYKKNQEKDIKYKRRARKVKNSKLKKLSLSKVRKESDITKKYVPFCSESQCFNLTGYWVFKWADGREEFRRYQTLGDWQFERAKARKDVREIELSNNWQFERAKARKELRSEDYGDNWQFRRALARESNRNDDQRHRGKFTKYSGKAFFQERFSWI